MKGQKEAVVEVFQGLGYPIPCDMSRVLTSGDFERTVDIIVSGIVSGQIKYGKDKNNAHEVRKYVRSMVKNHMNKAKELNGGSYSPVAKKVEVEDKGPALDRSVLSPELTTALDKYVSG